MKKVSVALLGCLALSVQADVFMQWDKKPLAIRLNLNQERIVTVEGQDSQVGIPASLNSILRVQSVGQAIYFKASQPFETTRVQLRNIENGKVILLDVSASDQGKDYEYEPVNIITQKVENNLQGTKLTEKSSDTKQSLSLPKSALPAPAALTRYAAQSLYAPLRAIEPLSGVYRVAMKLPQNIAQILPNLPIRATPLESFGLGDFVVTAVKIKNLSQEAITLDPRFLQGKYYAATFQHNRLGQFGSAEDTTVVYLVTLGKLTESMLY